MKNHYNEILSTLEKLTEKDESLNTRTDAESLLVAMQSFSFLCFLGLWQSVLREINDTQNYLQTEFTSHTSVSSEDKRLKQDVGRETRRTR